MLATEGFVCERMTVAGTGTLAFESASGVYDENSARLVFMDADFNRNRLDENAKLKCPLCGDSDRGKMPRLGVHGPWTQRLPGLAHHV